MYVPSVTPSLRASEAGFSLLEALISFAILALALSAVFSAGMFGLRATARAGERTDALMEARSLIDRLGTDMPLAAGTYEGTTQLGRAYRLIITPVTVGETAQLNAYAIEADVGARRKGPKPIISLKTLRTAKARS